TIAQKCVKAGFNIQVVQEGQRLHSLIEFVAQGVGVAILPRPSCYSPTRVVIRKLEDFDLPANLHLTWLRRNDSGLVRDFVEATRQVVAKPIPSSSVTTNVPPAAGDGDPRQPNGRPERSIAHG